MRGDRRRKGQRPTVEPREIYAQSKATVGEGTLEACAQGEEGLLVAPVCRRAQLVSDSSLEMLQPVRSLAASKPCVSPLHLIVL